MFLKYISFRLCLGLVPGIYLGEFLDLPLFYWVGLLLGSLACLAFSCRRHPILFSISMLISCVFIGAMAVSLRKPGANPSHYIHRVNSIEVYELLVLEELKETSRFRPYRCRVLYADGMKVNGKLLLKLTAGQPKLEAGERLTCRLRLSKPQSTRNPFQFDYARYLYLKGILHEARLEGELLNQTAARGSRHKISDFRKKIQVNLLRSGLQGQEHALLSAMLLGERSGLEEHTITNFRSAGAMHLLAISGMHIGMLLVFLNFMLSPLLWIPPGKIIRLILLLVFLWAYTLITGFNPSTVRATCMWSFMAWSLALGRVGQSPNTLSLSLLFMLLLIDPFLAFQPGMQLSYAAVFAIIGMGQVVIPRFRTRWMLLQKLWEFSVVSISAQLGVLPLILYYFHQFPLHFLLSNLVLVPTMAITLCSGILLALLSLFILLPSFASSFLEFLLFSMLRAAEFSGTLSQFVIRGISLDGIQFALLSGIVLMLIISLRSRQALRWQALLFLVIAFQAYTIGSAAAAREEAEFWVLHESGETVLLYRQGERSTIWSESKVDSLYSLRGFRANGKLQNLGSEELQGLYQFNNFHLSIARPGSRLTGPTDILLLSGSPKIHLDRLLQAAQPRLVIADGSNATYLLAHWKRSCSRLGIIFHDTRENGAINLLP